MAAIESLMREPGSGPNRGAAEREANRNPPSSARPSWLRFWGKPNRLGADNTQAPSVAESSSWRARRNAALAEAQDGVQQSDTDDDSRPSNSSMNTPRRRRFNSFRASDGDTRRERHFRAASGPPNSPGGGDRGPRGPRGSDHLPPDGGDREREPNPEWGGRRLVQEILKWESEDYNERYKDAYLDKLYIALQALVEKERKGRKGGREWDRGKDYRLSKTPQELRKEVEERLGIQRRSRQQAQKAINGYLQSELGQGGSSQAPLTEHKYNPDLSQSPSLAELIQTLNNDKSSIEERARAEEHIVLYYQDAKDKGILTGVDEILTSIYQKFAQGAVRRDQVRTLLKQQVIKSAQNELPEAVIAAQAAFRARRREDPTVAGLEGVWAPYIDMAVERFEDRLANRAGLPYREGEYRLELPQQLVQENSRETFWRTGNYPEYYEVTARTPEQFRKATESFLRMIKNKALGLSPDKLLPHMENFAKALGQAGNQPDVAASVTSDFMQELRQEFEGLSYIYGAWYTNETYNPEKYYQFMMALALHEGPQRLTALARAGDGQVAVFLKMLDDDPRARAYYLSGGSRGQIGNDTVTQNFLQSEYIEMLIEEGMGIRLKDYDPYDGTLNSVQSEADSRRAGEIKAEIESGNKTVEDLTANEKRIYNAALAREDRMLELGRIEAELRQIEEEVRNGKDRRRLSSDDQKIYDAYINNKAQIGIHQSDQRFKSLYEGFDYDRANARNLANANIKNWLEFRHLDPKLLPERLKKSVELGQVQEKIQRFKKEVENGTRPKLKEGEKVTKWLNPHEQTIYETAYDQAKANFDIASQMVGALGEKVKKGGGVFFVNRNANVRAYMKDYQKLDQLKFSQLSREQKIGRLLGQFRDGKQFFTEDEKEEEKFYESLSDEEKKDYVDNLPIDQATSFVQCVANMTRMIYANAPAKDRAAAVEQNVADAVAQIEQNGFEAKFALPKPRFDENPKSKTFGEIIGFEDQMQVIDFQTATSSVFARWTSHTYWGYQQENRHMLLNPDILEAAKRIRAGISNPEDEDILATQLLILDPTLKRVKRLPGDRMNREVMILEAAVEESDQLHWEIDRQLHRAFLPEDGDANKIQVGYNREDFGGSSRFIIATKAYVAAHSKRFARRYSAQIAESPIHVSSYPDIIGQDGVLGLISMCADPIGGMADQRIASQFSITKYVNQMRYGWMLFGHLYGYVDEEKGISIEGLYEKPTNNADQLVKYWEKLKNINKYPDAENEFFYALKESFGRLERVLQLMRVMESDTRNAQGAIKTDDVEVFLPDGRFNRAIAREDNRNTGTSRHSQRVFFDNFINWMLSDAPGGGVQAYPSEAAFYKFLREPYFYYDGNSSRHKTDKTWADWLFDKMAR